MTTPKDQAPPGGGSQKETDAAQTAKFSFGEYDTLSPEDAALLADDSSLAGTYDASEDDADITRKDEALLADASLANNAEAHLGSEDSALMADDSPVDMVAGASEDDTDITREDAALLADASPVDDAEAHLGSEDSTLMADDSPVDMVAGASEDDTDITREDAALLADASPVDDAEAHLGSEDSALMADDSLLPGEPVTSTAANNALTDVAISNFEKTMAIPGSPVADDSLWLHLEPQIYKLVEQHLPQWINQQITARINQQLEPIKDAMQAQIASAIAPESMQGYFQALLPEVLPKYLTPVQQQLREEQQRQETAAQSRQEAWQQELASIRDADKEMGRTLASTREAIENELATLKAAVERELVNLAGANEQQREQQQRWREEIQSRWGNLDYQSWQQQEKQVATLQERMRREFEKLSNYLLTLNNKEIQRQQQIGKFKEQVVTRLQILDKKERDLAEHLQKIRKQTISRRAFAATLIVIAGLLAALLLLLGKMI